jgi:division/cell wall cluster transcriptional repressor MraZ
MSRVGKDSVVSSTNAVNVFLGRYDYALDPKKRFTIPSGWRRAMGDPADVFVMPDPTEQCLNLIPPDLMRSRVEEMEKKELLDPSLNRLLRLIGQNSEQLTLDCQGRIRVCDKLLQFANLTTTVAMVGSVRLIKLWNPELLGPEESVNLDEFREAVKELGF